MKYNAHHKRPVLGRFQWKNNQRNWLVFSVFAGMFLLKNILFHCFSFHTWFWPGEHGFYTWMSMFLPKLATALLFASPVFFCKDKRWMIIPALVMDTWCIANWIYMRNNNFLLDSFAFNIAGNLNGYWWSVLVFIEWGLDLLMYALSGASFFIFRFCKRTQLRAWKMGLGIVVLSLLVHYAGEGCYLLSRPADQRPQFCLDIATREGRERVYGIDYEYLVAHTSLLSMPIYLLPDHIEIRQGKVYDRAMTDEEQSLAQQHMLSQPQPVHSDKLILIICESLENWVCRDDIMPHLAALTRMDHVFYADNVQTQIVGAPSADGQMIINTGLLPLTEGYTCFRYPQHIFPGLMHTTTDSTVLILPHDTAVWNQTMMSPAYGYDTTIIYSDLDTELFDKLNEVQQSGITHIQCITQSTHAPFVSCELSHLQMPSDMPFFMSRFMRAFNVLDNGLGHFVSRIQSDPQLRDYTIVITADHHILYKEKREKYQAYCQRHHLDYHPESAALPLIIYSPHIQGNIHYTEPCYQMDIYPTILHLIGADHYAWQGLGVNLLDSQAVAHRSLDPDQALLLSDKMLRNDWFRGRIE